MEGSFLDPDKRSVSMGNSKLRGRLAIQIGHKEGEVLGELQEFNNSDQFGVVYGEKSPF